MRVYIGSAIWRTVEAAHLKSLASLLLVKDVIYAPVVGDALIDRSRSISASRFLLDSDADVHLSIDSDITDFSVEDAAKLCNAAMTHDIVAGVYVTRSMDRTFPTSFTKDGEELFMAFDHTPVEVEYVATGFMATHRRVFERLAEDLPLLHPKDFKFYPFYLPMIVNNAEGDPIELSEDWAFCERAKQAGFKCYVDPAIRLGHRGTFTYRVEDMFVNPIQPHPVSLQRNGGNWRIRSLSEPTPQQESRQVRRARERQEAVAAARA